MTDPQDPRSSPHAGRPPLPGRPTPDRSRPLPPHLDPRGPRRGPARAPREVHGSARVPSGPPRRGRLARALSVVAVAASSAVLAVSVGGYALVHHYDRKVDRVDNAFPTDGQRPAAAPRDARNILLVGSDSRGDLAAGEGTQGRGDSFVTGQRSDTMILVHLYGDSDEAQLISFPRDSWVTIPEHTSPETGEVVPEHEGKLNSAFEGGAPVLVETIENLSQLRIDHFVQIDFDGFQAMVEQLDGVEVCLSQPARELQFSGIDLPAGRQVIKGDQALAFVRQRVGLPNGDLDRIARQQQFIGAIVRKTLSAGTLLNPFKLNGVIGVAADSVQVDDGTSIDDLRDLATRLRNFDAGGVTFSTVPVAQIDGRRAGQDVVLLDEVEAEQVFDRLRRDVPPSVPDAPADEPEEPLIVAPEAVQVRVFNGAGVQGLGRRAYDDLAAQGFSLVGAPDNRGSEARQTTVYHGPDKADSARTVAAAVPGARTELDPDLGRTLELVVGSSYSGAEPVRVQGRPEPARSPSAAPAVKTAAEDPCAA